VKLTPPAPCEKRPDMPKPPEFPAAEVAAKIASALEKLPGAVAEAEAKLRADWEAAKVRGAHPRLRRR